MENVNMVVKPMLSIIIAVDDYSNNLISTIKSIYSQEPPGYFVDIIIKSRSKFEYKNIKKDKPGWLNIKLIISEDKSLSDAWNQALEGIKTKWVLFWGSGEEFPNTRVLKDVANSIKYSDAMLLAGIAVVRDSAGKFITRTIPDDMVNKNKIFRTIPYHHNALFHNFKIFHNNKFNINLKFSADYELILKSKAYLIVEHLRNDIVLFTNDGMSSDIRNSLKIGLEFFITQIKFSPTKYAYLALYQFLINLIKYIIYILLQDKAADFLRKLSKKLGYNIYLR